MANLSDCLMSVPSRGARVFLAHRFAAAEPGFLLSHRPVARRNVVAHQPAAHRNAVVAPDVALEPVAAAP